MPCGRDVASRVVVLEFETNFSLNIETRPFKQPLMHYLYS